jgi:hypothetical protein
VLARITTPPILAKQLTLFKRQKYYQARRMVVGSMPASLMLFASLLHKHTTRQLYRDTPRSRLGDVSGVRSVAIQKAPDIGSKIIKRSETWP